MSYADGFDLRACPVERHYAQCRHKPVRWRVVALDGCVMECCQYCWFKTVQHYPDLDQKQITILEDIAPADAPHVPKHPWGGPIR
jgi:hypothetical protein